MTLCLSDGSSDSAAAGLELFVVSGGTKGGSREIGNNGPPRSRHSVVETRLPTEWLGRSTGYRSSLSEAGCHTVSLGRIVYCHTVWNAPETRCNARRQQRRIQGLLTTQRRGLIKMLLPDVAP